jgi:hypothetical protein
MHTLHKKKKLEEKIIWHQWKSKTNLLLETFMTYTCRKSYLTMFIHFLSLEEVSVLFSNNKKTKNWNENYTKKNFKSKLRRETWSDKEKVKVEEEWIL